MRYRRPPVSCECYSLSPPLSSASSPTTCPPCTLLAVATAVVNLIARIARVYGTRRCRRRRLTHRPSPTLCVCVLLVAAAVVVAILAHGCGVVCVVFVAAAAVVDFITHTMLL